MDPRRVDGLKGILAKIDDYFSDIAKTDAKKAAQRYENYLELRQRISGLGQPIPGLGIVYSIEQFKEYCGGQINHYKGAAGSGRLSAILTELQSTLIEGDEVNLKQAQADFTAERGTEYLKAAAKWADGDLKSYIDNRESDLREAQKKKAGASIRFHKGKVVEPDVTQGKVNLAKQLSESIMGLGPQGAKITDPADMIKSVLQIESSHKALIKLATTNGQKVTEGDFGTLINEAKDMLKMYYPAEYAQAKRDLTRVEPHIVYRHSGGGDE